MDHPGDQEMLLAISKAGVWYFYGSAMSGAYAVCAKGGLGDGASLVIAALMVVLLHGIVVTMSATGRWIETRMKKDVPK